MKNLNGITNELEDVKKKKLKYYLFIFKKTLILCNYLFFKVKGGQSMNWNFRPLRFENHKPP